MHIHFQMIFILLFSYATLLPGDKITVNNQTNQEVYVAIYTQKNLLRVSDANRYTNHARVVPSGRSVLLDRPDYSVGYDRELAFSFNKESLTDSLKVQEFNAIAHINIGNKNITKIYYIAQEKGKLKGFNQAEWKIVQPALLQLKHAKNETINAIARPAQDLIRQNLSELQDYQHKNESARVRIGNTLNDDEKKYLSIRKPRVKAALEKLVGHSIEAVPTIALVESGGGYRAMTCSLGWHVGATKMGLMDAVTYMVGLSGSTWSIGLWVLSGLSIEQFKEQLIPLMNGIDKVSPDEFKLMANSWLIKTVFNQELTLVDLYSGLLANALLKPFGDERQRISLSEQASKIAGGQLPFPLYTAVRAEDREKQDWYEFSPYEIGASWLGMYVPTWAYGRRFDNGVSIDFAPEQSFGFQMGTFGSAFGANIDQIMTQMTQHDPLDPPLDTIVNAMIDRIGQERITRARVFNFTANMGGIMSDAPQMKLVDAGVAFNLPYPPISGERPERKADIIIFLDASGGTIGDDLRKVEQYARSKGLKFPTIDYTSIGKNAVSIFKGEDASVPLVIYLPRVMDAQLFGAQANNPEYADLSMLIKGFDIDACLKNDYCNTNNFKYVEKQIRQLSGLTEFNIRASAQIIKDAIDWKINQMVGKSGGEKKSEEPKPSVPVSPIIPAPVVVAPISKPATGNNLMGADAGNGYRWNNPPYYQVQCVNGAEFKEDTGGPCNFMSKHCGCVCPAGKTLYSIGQSRTRTGVQKNIWGCR